MTIKGIVPSQKNAKRMAINSRTGKPFPVTAERVKIWQESAAWQLKGKKKYKGEVGVEITVYNPDKRARDIDNQASTVLDALVKAHIIEEDNCNYLKELSVFYGGIDKENPRAEIQPYQLGKD